ncbi:hypothetical protein D0S45_08845 [Marinifilum sp. JC120]|nr:hypothetical protein D0S45_08845 [Marinifilum sp. JC120]
MNEKLFKILIILMILCALPTSAASKLDVRSSKLLEEAAQSAVMVINTESIFLLGNEDIRLKVSGPFPELESILLANMADSSNRYDFSANGTRTLHVKSSIHKSGFFKQPHVRIKIFLKATDQKGRVVWSDQVWSPKLRDFSLLNNWLFGLLAGLFLILFFYIIPSAGYKLDLPKTARTTLKVIVFVAFSAAIIYYLL